MLTTLLLILAAVLVALPAVLFVRALRCTSHRVEVPPAAGPEIDADAVAKRLAGAVRFPTVSYPDPAHFDREAFLGLHTYLAQSFPRVHSALRREVVGDYSLLYTWPGQDTALKPMLLMAHLDVVPVEPSSEGNWTYPPFSGQIADGYIWGRGTLDCKGTAIGAIQAVEMLLEEGFQPRRTVLLALGHDEEVSGRHGAAAIAALLRSRGVEPEYVLDEGGGVTEGLVPGVRVPVAAIGIAEKGYLSLELTVESKGGHSSAPPRHTAIGILSQAIVRLERRPFPARLAGVPRSTFERLAPEMPLGMRLVLANLWLFRPLLERVLLTSPEIAAMLRTTTAATIFQAGVKDNILPQRARAVVNLRLQHGDTVDGAIARVRRLLRGLPVQVRPVADEPCWAPSPVSDPDSPAYALLQRTIRTIYPGAVVVPFLVTGATDSRYYASLCHNVFRFSPIAVGREDLARIHGTDERIAVADYARCVRFYRTLIQDTAS